MDPNSELTLANMVMSFRVSELQMFLGFAGQNKTGRKNDLQARALDLVRNRPSAVIANKVKDLYASIQEERIKNRNMRRSRVPQTRTNPNIIQYPYQRQGGSVLNPGGVMELPPHPSIPIVSRPPQHTSQQALLRNPQSMISPAYSIQQRQVPRQGYEMDSYAQPHMGPTTTVDVTFKRLPFYDILNELLPPTPLVSNNNQVREQGQNFYFYLTSSQANEVSLNRDIVSSTKNDYVVQIQMRFCILDTSVEQEDCYPPGLQLKINGKHFPIPQHPVPINKPTNEPKRIPRPLNISHSSKLSPGIANQIVVTWTPDYTRNYACVVNLVRRLDASDLLQRLKKKGPRHADFTTSLIKEKLNEDADCEIATTMLRVSLMCPLGRTRMVTPCRPSTCLHLQCFDAFIYIQMNEKKPTWVCPVCDKQALYDNLIVDDYFQQVLSSPLLPSDSHEIQLNKDGSWSSESTKKTVTNIDTSKNVEEIIDELDSDANSADEGIGSEGNANDEVVIKKDKIEVIDLCDSDDDTPSPKEPTPQTPQKEVNNKAEESIIMLDSPSPPMKAPSPSSCAVAASSGVKRSREPVLPTPPLPVASHVAEPGLRVEPTPFIDPNDICDNNDYNSYLRRDSHYQIF